MNAQQVVGRSLRPVTSVEVTVLLDNTVDALLSSTEVVRRPPLLPDAFDRPALRAEHGYSALITVDGGPSVLYDAGISKDGAAHNLSVLGVVPTDLRAVVLSHGHADHHGGLEGLLPMLGRPRLPLLLHPDAWRQRRLVFPTGAEVRLPPPSQADLAAEGVEVVEERGPSLLLDGHLLITGQTERSTPFEPGLPGQEALVDGNWEPDPWTWDDQAVVVNVRGRGLVVVSGCSHSGAVNVMVAARRQTGVKAMCAFVGGMHLAGPVFEPIIPQTVAAVRELAPEFLVPGHCTSWRAQAAMATALPDAYVASTVGTTLRFEATSTINEGHDSRASHQDQRSVHTSDARE
jgi:7,8-dihydropterin-6-yl-methyl-4-(beta-D-ribofuranosyl)aminobenzene 5'-phosphate synthase